jgi:hypothetical protein
MNKKLIFSITLSIFFIAIILSGCFSHWQGDNASFVISFAGAERSASSRTVGEDNAVNVQDFDHRIELTRENEKRVFGKRMTLKENVQNDIGVNKNFHSRYFANLLSRICSRVISPASDNAPKSESASGVGCEKMAESSSECGCGDVSSSAFLRTGLSCFSTTGVSFTPTLVIPAGISRGAKNSKKPDGQPV